MKNVGKIFIFLMIVLLLFNLSGCSSKESSILIETEVEGSGEIVLKPQKDTYEKGEVVKITAKPDSDMHFAYWKGNLTGNQNPIEVPIDSNLKVIAVFYEDDAPPKIEPIEDINITAGKKIQFSVSASDPNGDKIDLSTDEKWEQFFKNETGEFLWDTTVDEAGVYEIPFTAEANGKSYKTTVKLSVILPRLHVEGNKIVDEFGNERELHGVTMVDPVHAKDLFHHFEESDFEVMREWGAEIVNIPIYPDLYVNQEDFFVDYIDPLVKWAKRQGLYVILHNWAHGNAVTGEINETIPSDSIWYGNPYKPDKEITISALKDMAHRYKDKPWVSYGIYGEPHAISWNEWKYVAEDIIDAVRQVDSEAMLFVPGVNFATDLSGVLDNPVERDNIVYEAHIYPGNNDNFTTPPDNWENVLYKLSNKKPVFMGEWGLINKDNIDTYGRNLVALCDRLDIGWTANTWSSEVWDWKPTMFSELRGFNTTIYETNSFGDFVRESLGKY